MNPEAPGRHPPPVSDQRSIFAPPHRRELAAVCLSFLVADAAFASMPVLLSAYLSTKHYSMATAGAVASAETAGLALGSLVMARLLPRTTADWRRLVCGLLIGLAAVQLLCALVSASALFAALRFTAGTLVGAVQAGGSLWIARFPQSERPFALFIGMTFLGGAVAMPVLGAVEPMIGLEGSFALFAVIIAASIPLLLRWYPRTNGAPGTTGASTGTLAGPRWTWPLWLLLASISLNFALNSGVWMLLGEAGLAAGVDPSLVSRALGVGMGVALLVTTLVATVRAGAAMRGRVVLANGVLMVGAAALALRGGGPFLAAVLLFHLGIALASPYYLAALARLDVTGRASVGGIVAMNLGYCLGPVMLATIVSSTGLRAGIAVSSIAFATCAGAAWLLLPAASAAVPARTHA